MKPSGKDDNSGEKSSTGKKDKQVAEFDNPTAGPANAVSNSGETTAAKPAQKTVKAI